MELSGTDHMPRSYLLTWLAGMVLKEGILRVLLALKVRKEVRAASTELVQDVQVSNRSDGAEVPEKVVH